MTKFRTSISIPVALICSIVAMLLISACEPSTFSYTDSIRGVFKGNPGLTITPTTGPGTMIKLTQTIAQSAVGQNVIFSVKVTANGFPVPPSGQVILADAFAQLAVVQLVQGKADISINWLSSGDHTIWALYQDPSSFFGSSSSWVDHVVTGKNQTRMRVSPSSNPSKFNQPATVKIDVDTPELLAGLPPYDVLVYIDNKALALPLNLNYVATSSHSWEVQVTLPNLSVGSHSVLVSYPPQTNFLGTGYTYAQVVN